MDNVKLTIEDVYSFIELNIGNDKLKKLLLIVFDRNKEQITSATAGNYHHNYAGGLLQHSYNVAILCLDIVERYDYVDINKDLLLTAALLHDIGKIQSQHNTNVEFVKHNILSTLLIEPLIVECELDVKSKLALYNVILTHMQSVYDTKTKAADVVLLESVILHAVDTVDAFIDSANVRINNTAKGCCYDISAVDRVFFKPNI